MFVFESQCYILPFLGKASVFSDCLFDQIQDSFTDFYPSNLSLGCVLEKEKEFAMCFFHVFNVLYCVADVPHAWCDASGSQT